MTGVAFSKTLHLPEAEIHAGLVRLEAEGSLLRGEFTRRETEWCDRRLLAPIHRLTLGALRKEIEPVTPAEFMRWLLGWQHVGERTQLIGERGVFEAIRQLQGFEAPANSWEREILARRLSGYDPEFLDRLCLAGTVGWGRFSPVSRRAMGGAPGDDSASGMPAPFDFAQGREPVERQAGRRVAPTSVSPIAFFIREEADWASAHTRPVLEDLSRRLSAAAAEVLEFLGSHGASFFADLVRGTGRLRS